MKHICLGYMDETWAHKDNKDAEWRAFVPDNASGGGQLLFGRITYELIIRVRRNHLSYRPTHETGRKPARHDSRWPLGGPS